MQVISDSFFQVTYFWRIQKSFWPAVRCLLTITTIDFSPRAERRCVSSDWELARSWRSCALDFEAWSTFLLYTSKHSCSNWRSILSLTSSLSPTSSHICCNQSSIIYSPFPHSQKENDHIQELPCTHRERGLDSIPTWNFWAHLLFSIRINAVSNPSSHQGMNLTIEGVIASVFTTWYSRTLCCSDMASQSHSDGELHWGLINIYAMGVKFQQSTLKLIHSQTHGWPPSYPSTPR